MKTKQFVVDDSDIEAAYSERVVFILLYKNKNRVRVPFNYLSDAQLLVEEISNIIDKRK